MDVEKSLRLVGAGMNDTKIVSAAPGHVVQFNGPGVFVAEGITYEYLGEQSANVLVVKDGIIVHEQAEPTLEENYITDNRGTGIWYQGENGGTARGNDCFRNGAGIVVAGQSKPSLEENVCRNNVQVGIEFRDQSGGMAKENECSANKVGIRLANDANPELIDNYCHDNTEEDLLDERS